MRWLHAFEPIGPAVTCYLSRDQHCQKKIKHALEIAEEQRNRGSKVWIQDENGRSVDEETLKSTLRETVIGFIIWVLPPPLLSVVFVHAVC